jgi:hypothetical protein
MESGESNLYHLHRAPEAAPISQASLSPELLEALALDAEAAIAIGSCPWRSHIVLDQTALGPTHLLPQAFDFFTRPLEDRFATITHYDNLIMAAYQCEANDPEHLAIARQAAHELAIGLGLDASAIARVRIISTLNNHPRLHAVPDSSD